jgi:hypothetical protein
MESKVKPHKAINKGSTTTVQVKPKLKLIVIMILNISGIWVVDI